MNAVRSHCYPVIAAALVLLAAIARAAEPLRLVDSIPLPSVEGRIDHIAFDPEGQRLFVAALENNSVEVADLATRTVVQSIKNVSNPQGVCMAPALNRLAVANDYDGSLRLYDGASLRQLYMVNLTSDADNVRYDPVTGRFWVGYGAGGLAAIDAQSGKQVANVPLDGHPESFQLDTNGKRIFVNIPTASQVAVLDSDKAMIVAKWSVKKNAANFPMALDEEHHRLFVGCRKPAELLVLDTTTGRTIKSVAVAGDADDVFYDAAEKRIYISGGAGVVTVISQTDADTYEPVASVATAAGARTSYFDSASKTLYVAVPHRNNQAAEIRVFKVH